MKQKYRNSFLERYHALIFLTTRFSQLDMNLFSLLYSTLGSELFSFLCPCCTSICPGVITSINGWIKFLQSRLIFQPCGEMIALSNSWRYSAFDTLKADSCLGRWPVSAHILCTQQHLGYIGKIFSLIIYPAWDYFFHSDQDLEILLQKLMSEVDSCMNITFGKKMLDSREVGTTSHIGCLTSGQR